MSSLHLIVISICLLFIFLLLIIPPTLLFSFFFFNDTATTEIYTLSLHDALPISFAQSAVGAQGLMQVMTTVHTDKYEKDRKSTRLNSSHQIISYAVFCLKKKKKKKKYVNRCEFCVSTYMNNHACTIQSAEYIATT